MFRNISRLSIYSRLLINRPILVNKNTPLVLLSTSSINNSKTCRSIFTTSCLLNNTTWTSTSSTTSNTISIDSNSNTNIDTKELDNGIKYQSYIDNAIDNFKLKQPDLTLEFLDRAVKLCPDKVDAYLLRADINDQIYFKSKHPTKQLVFDDLKKALDLSVPERSMSILISLLEWCDKNKENKLQNQYLMTAKSLDYYNIDFIKYMVENKKEKIENLLAIAKRLIDVNNNYGLYMLAKIHYFQKDYGKAEEMYHQVIQLESKRLGWSYGDQGTNMKSTNAELIHNRFLVRDIDGYRRIIEFHGDNDRDEKSTLFISFVGLAETFSKMKKPVNSYASYYQAVILKPKVPRVQFHLSELSLKLENYRQGLLHVYASLEADAVFPSTLYLDKKMLRVKLNLLGKKYVGAILDLEFLAIQYTQEHDFHIGLFIQNINLMNRIFPRIIKDSNEEKDTHFTTKIKQPLMLKHDPKGIMAVKPTDLIQLQLHALLLKGVYMDLKKEQMDPQSLNAVYSKLHFVTYVTFSLSKAFYYFGIAQNNKYYAKLTLSLKKQLQLYNKFFFDFKK
ncbi:hypothetical protein CYY_000413 [Polysphondylium violaceum]|uniref:Uncharacterized protein n=1 Tax=Polysphondylium violaceum TaxID=133409 RepID=A0A8J4Q1X6_9MYCE|nr:hypothetical protein CYY_000413 [Polysphondylium violaceum]